MNRARRGNSGEIDVYSSKCGMRASDVPLEHDNYFQLRINETTTDTAPWTTHTRTAWSDTRAATHGGPIVHDRSIYGLNASSFRNAVSSCPPRGHRTKNRPDHPRSPGDRARAHMTSISALASSRPLSDCRPLKSTRTASRGTGRIVRHQRPSDRRQRSTQRTNR